MAVYVCICVFMCSHAHTQVVLQEAGGRITDMAGKPYRCAACGFGQGRLQHACTLADSHRREGICAWAVPVQGIVRCIVLPCSVFSRSLLASNGAIHDNLLKYIAPRTEELIRQGVDLSPWPQPKKMQAQGGYK